MNFTLFKKKHPKNQLVACADGIVKPIEDADDEVFSSKALGDGVLIEPSSDVLVSPVDGIVTMLMEDSFHALAVKDKNGMEIMLHVGIDTVSMNGEGFEALVKINDCVKKGQPLLKFDHKRIVESGFSDQIMMVLTNAQEFGHVEFFSKIEAEGGKTIVSEYEIK